jgi:hypothetical protein
VLRAQASRAQPRDLSRARFSRAVRGSRKGRLTVLRAQASRISRSPEPVRLRSGQALPKGKPRDLTRGQ